MYGPTRPLEVPEPQGCEVAESDLIVRATDEVSCGSPHAVLEFVESLALRVVQKFVTETEKQWACAYPFGSCGLSASVADSDLDMYGEYFHNSLSSPSLPLSFC
uniref:Uncharacterized protein TCIL3000_3_2080 n=1 Tax=Trypanosoma congolense (strain IL3000) TaxID=1068625 RepID=G0UK73_TRYCI|nr:unnamed protein product [Trypanosoma congolense IL3000]